MRRPGLFLMLITLLAIIVSPVSSAQDAIVTAQDIMQMPRTDVRQDDAGSSVPVETLYRFYFQHLANLDAYADALDGNHDDGAPFRMHEQRVTGLSDEQIEAVKRLAADCNRAIKEVDAKIQQALAAAEKDASLPRTPSFELQALFTQRNQVIDSHISELRELLDAESFDRLDHHVAHAFQPGRRPGFVPTPEAALPQLKPSPAFVLPPPPQNVPSVLAFSHTTIAGGRLFPECFTKVEDSLTFQNYRGLDALCGMEDGPVEIARWECPDIFSIGSPDLTCTPPSTLILPAFAGHVYGMISVHSLFGFFDSILGGFDDVFDYRFRTGDPFFRDFVYRIPRLDNVQIWPDSPFPITGVFETSFTPVTITPSSAELTAKQPQTFQANQNVTWVLQGPGTKSDRVDSTVYQASPPISVPTAARLTACSTLPFHDDNCASAFISLLPITVTIDAAHTEVIQGQSEQLDAIVGPVAGAIQDVKWSVDNTSAATISGNGLFIANPFQAEPAEVVVTACSVADPARCGTITMTVAIPSISISLAPGSTDPFLARVGATVQFLASVTGVTDPDNQKKVSFELALAFPGDPPRIGTIDATTGVFTVNTVPPAAGAINVNACTPMGVTGIQICSQTLSVHFVPPVSITSVVPNVFNAGESKPVTISGSGFSSNPLVVFQDPNVVFQRTTADPGGLFVSGNVIIQPLPAGGTVNVTVTSGFSPTTTPPPSASAPVQVRPVTTVTSVSPPSATLIDSQTQQFTGSVTCITAGGLPCTVSQAVLCSISPNVGTMSTSCLYVAPASIAVAQTITGRACSAFSGVCVTFPINLVPVTVSVTPAAATLQAGQSQQFQATVTNAPGGNQGVTWSIAPAIGSINATGSYVAPTPVAGSQSVTVRACSVVDPARCGTSIVTLVPVSVVVSPKSATLQSGQTQQFSASVTGSANAGVTWSVSSGAGVPQGTISGSGLYTAPAPPIVGPQTNTITACSIADGSKCDTATVNLISTTPVGQLTPSSLTFGSQLVGTTSTTQSITLTNTGAASLTLTSIMASGDFLVAGNTCATPLPLNGSCAINVAFAPATSGTRTGTLTVTNNASNSPQLAALTGTGVAPAVCLAPASIDFGGQNVGTSSAPRAITLTNCGTAPLTINAITVTGDFSQTSNCPASLAVNTSCAINVLFTPAASGARTGSLLVTGAPPAPPQTAALSGTGTVPGASLSPTSLTFSGQNAGTTSPAQIVTLTNTGTGPLSIASVATSGDFRQTNTCATAVAAGANCTISVTFAPAATGSRTGALSIADNAAGSPHTAALSGTGTIPNVVLTPSNLTFGAQAVTTVSAPQVVTLTNNGTGPLSISAISASGDFRQSNGCASSLAAGASCTISVTFAPTIVGTRTGVLSVTDSAPGSPHSVSLTGTAIGPPDFSLSIGGTQTVDPMVTNQVIFPFTVTYLNGLSGTVTVNVNNTVFNFASPWISPSTFAGSGNGNLALLLPAGVTPGTYAVTITAAGPGGTQHSATTSLTILDNPPPPNGG